MDTHNTESKTNYRQVLEEKHIKAEKLINKQMKVKRGNKNYLTQNIRSMSKCY
jgi:hypothetical protein